MAAYFRPATWSLLMRDEASGDLFYTVAVGKGCESVNNLKLKSGDARALGHRASPAAGDCRCQRR